MLRHRLRAQISGHRVPIELEPWNHHSQSGHLMCRSLANSRFGSWAIDVRARSANWIEKERENQGTQVDQSQDTELEPCSLTQKPRLSSDISSSMRLQHYTLQLSYGCAESFPGPWNPNSGGKPWNEPFQFVSRKIAAWILDGTMQQLCVVLS